MQMQVHEPRTGTTGLCSRANNRLWLAAQRHGVVHEDIFVQHRDGPRQQTSGRDTEWWNLTGSAATHRPDPIASSAPSSTCLFNMYGGFVNDVFSHWELALVGQHQTSHTLITHT